MRAIGVALLALWPAAPSATAADAVPRPVLAIEGVTVVDVERGTASGPRTVLVVDGRIAAIEAPERAVPPPGATRVDGRGRYLVPGLIDAHVHLFNNASQRPPNDWAFPLFVARGVTAVRDMHSLPSAMPLVAGWQAAVARGELVAPRVIAMGRAMAGDDGAALRLRVQEAAAGGLGFVKTFSELPEPAWREVLAAARAAGLPVHGHVPAGVGVLEASRAGQRSAEHLLQVYEACSADEPRWLALRQGAPARELARMRDDQERAVLEAFDPAACERTAAALARAGMAQVPTLVLPHAESHRDPRFRDDPRWRLLRADEQARWARILEGEVVDQALAARRWEVSRRIVAMLHAAGVPLVAGTDAPMPLVYPGDSLHDELARFVDAGLTPAAALRAATLAPARMLGLEAELGSIEVGKRADLVLLGADPLAAVANLRRIEAVVLDGRLLGPRRLAEMVAMGGLEPPTSAL